MESTEAAVDEKRQRLKAVDLQIEDARRLVTESERDLARSKGILREAEEHRGKILRGEEIR